MLLNRFTNAVVMLLVAAGLLLAPLATAASAMPVSGAGSGMQAMSDDMQATDGMPCCPDQTKSKPCDSCPFVAPCMLSLSFPAPSGASSVIERQPQRSALMPSNDSLRDGLAAQPPDHPPRSQA